MRPTFLLLALFILPFTANAQQQPPPPITIAIRAGKLIDVTHSRLLTNQLILIRDGKISASRELQAIADSMPRPSRQA